MFIILLINKDIILSSFYILYMFLSRIQNYVDVTLTFTYGYTSVFISCEIRYTSAHRLPQSNCHSRMQVAGIRAINDRYSQGDRREQSYCPFGATIIIVILRCKGTRGIVIYICVYTHTHTHTHTQSVRAISSQKKLL